LIWETTKPRDLLVVLPLPEYTLRSYSYRES